MQFGGYSLLFDAFIGSHSPFAPKKSVRNLAMHKSKASIGSFPFLFCPVTVSSKILHKVKILWHSHTNSQANCVG